LPGWQAVYNELQNSNFVVIAAAQDTGGEAVARQWYDRAKADFVTLVDENHTISSLYNLVNVPSAVWIDETGQVIRIDEGAYAETHKMGEFEFGRNDYAPMVTDWVRKGAERVYAKGNSVPELARTEQQALAEPNFKLGVYFHKQGDAKKADKYWAKAQQLNPDSWNYHRQDWSFTPAEAGPNWARKYQSLGDKPYYRPIEGLDP
jgi:tetratricopeptide (TPR) repeat protein